MDEVRHFSVMCSERTRCDGLNHGHRKFCANVQKNFHTVRVMEQWNRLPREVVEPPSVERPIWMPTCMSYCKVPALAGGVEFDDLLWSLPTPLIL